MNKLVLWLSSVLVPVFLFAGDLLGANLPTLSRGINLSHWLSYEGRQPVVQADMELIRKAGFDHVRVSFDPAFLGWLPDAPGEKATVLEDIGKLDAAVDLAIKSGLVVVLDFHPAEALKDRIEKESDVQNAFVNLWGTLAFRYRDRPTDKLVFEVLNEPQFWKDSSPERWHELRGKALAAIRKWNKNHLVLLSGRMGGGLQGLLEEPTVSDPTVAYTFHYYEPMLLTHLGAPWEPHLSNVQGMITGLRYPPSANTWTLDSSGKIIDPGNLIIKANADEALVTSAVQDYVSWGPSRFAGDFSKVQKWSSAHAEARVICNEFGVILPGMDLASRSAWLRDVRGALENHQLGWAVWDYSDAFGIAMPTGETYLTGDGVTVAANPARPISQFRESDLSALGLPIANAPPSP